MVETATAPLDWREEFIKIPRTPRPGWNLVKSLLIRAMNAQISLRQEQNHSLIVLKFPASVQQLPEEFQDIYSQLGVRIENIFSEVLYKKPNRKGTSTLWSELVRVGYKAYREAWLHLLESLYLDHFHPRADRILRKDFKTLRKQTARRPGRRQVLAKEKLSIEGRYRELLVECTAIRGIVQDCIKKNLGEQEIRRTVFQGIYGRRFDKDVLTNGGAWAMIPYGKQDKVVCLQDLTSWKPHQLAIALLAKEREVTEYQTIEKKTAYIRKHRRYKQTRRN